MQLVEHRPGDHYHIGAIEDGGIRVVDVVHATSLLLTRAHLDTDWPVHSVNDLDAEALAPIWALEPEVVVLGTGRRHQFPSRDVQVEFLRRGIGLEVMTLDAAARTFNVLVSEDRRVLAALIWDDRNEAGTG